MPVKDFLETQDSIRDAKKKGKSKRLAWKLIKRLNLRKKRLENGSERPAVVQRFFVHREKEKTALLKEVSVQMLC